MPLVVGLIVGVCVSVCVCGCARARALACALACVCVCGCLCALVRAYMRRRACAFVHVRACACVCALRACVFGAVRVRERAREHVRERVRETAVSACNVGRTRCRACRGTAAPSGAGRARPPKIDDPLQTRRSGALKIGFNGGGGRGGGGPASGACAGRRRRRAQACAPTASASPPMKPTPAAPHGDATLPATPTGAETAIPPYRSHATRAERRRRGGSNADLPGACAVRARRRGRSCLARRAGRRLGVCP